jgi:polysaccharide export outer membrane protein
MRNKDVIYMSNARSVESEKLKNHLRLVNATIQDPIQTAIAGYALKPSINGTSTGSAFVTSAVSTGH